MAFMAHALATEMRVAVLKPLMCVGRRAVNDSSVKRQFAEPC